MQQDKTPAFDVNRRDFYTGQFDERTRHRLTKILNLGMIEVSIAEFGFPGVMSGLYIERVWSYSDEEFLDYLEWANGLIQKSKNKSGTISDSCDGPKCSCGKKMELAPSEIVYECECGYWCYSSS